MAKYKQVSFGSAGEEVKQLQNALNNSSGNYGLETDGVFGEKTLAAVKDYQQKNNLSVDGIVGDNTWGSLTGSNSSTTLEQAVPKAPTWEYTPYQPSDTVARAEELLKQQLSKAPGAYQSTWQTQLNDTLQKILNREKFSYDLNGDALYQQYKDQYTTQGKMAMMDTMGQAQAMTGGYGNSYAQTAGQQAYQGQLQQLNNVIPELYQLALNQYNQEGQDLYNQYGMYADREAQDYGRYRDQVSDYNAELGRLTEDARYKAEQDYGKWADAQSFGYQQERDRVSDAQWQAQFDEAKRQYDEQMALSKSKSSGNGGTEPYVVENTEPIYKVMTEEQKKTLRAQFVAAGSREKADALAAKLIDEDGYDEDDVWPLYAYYKDQFPTGGMGGGGRQLNTIGNRMKL